MMSQKSCVRAVMMACAVALGGALALTMSGCALSAGSGTSSSEARDTLYSTLDNTQSRLGGTWDNQDDPTARGCVVPVWAEGELFPALRVGDAPTRTADALDTVSVYWSDLGLTLTTTDVGDVLELQGESEFGEVLILRVSAGAMTLQGESECVPTSR